MAFAIYTEHQTETAIPAGLNAGEGILNHHGPPGRCVKQGGSTKISIRRRFARKFQIFNHVAVHPHIKQSVDATGFKYCEALFAR